MNSEIRKLAKWAKANGFRVEDDASGYTRFYARDGTYVGNYPATPSNPRRRRMDLVVALKRAGLQIPPPGKGEKGSPDQPKGDD